VADRFRYSKIPKDEDVTRLQRETEDNFFSKDKNGNLVLNKDIHCRSLYVEGESLYIGGIKVKSPIHSDDTGTWQYEREKDQFGFGTTLYVQGLRVAVVAKIAAYTMTADDDVVTCGAGNQTFTIDLPAPVIGKTFYIKNVGTGVITVDADTTGSTTIDGDTTQTINQYECLKVVSDATVYWSI